MLHIVLWPHLPKHGSFEFEDENAAAGHPGGVEALPHPAVSPSMTSRRFPPPWTVTELEGAAFHVVDATGQRIGTFFYREDAVAFQAQAMTRDEARRMAVNFARLPELLGKAERERTEQ